MTPSAKRMWFRLGTLLLVIASIAGRTESGAQHVEQPPEVFRPTKIFSHSRLNLWLGTEDCVVQLHLDLPERITKSTKVPVTGVLTAGPEVHKYKMPQGAAPQPPWPKEQDHLYKQEKLRSGFAVCKPTGKVDNSQSVHTFVELEITLDKLIFEDKVLRIDRPIVVFWNMPPPP